MLGTEQVNLIPRMITPLLEGVESIRVTDQVAKSMGLVDNQIVRGVVEDRQGLARLILNNRDFELKSSKKFKPGDVIEFRVKQSPSGMTLQASQPNQPQLQAPLPLSIACCQVVTQQKSFHYFIGHLSLLLWQSSSHQNQ